MRILFLNHNVRYGGTYYRAMPMAEQLAAKGHIVTLLTVSPNQRWRADWSLVNGVRLGEMPNWGQGYSGEGYGPLDNLLRIAHAGMERYDIIHLCDHKPNASFAGFSARLRGAKLVSDWIDWWGGPGGINDVPHRRFPIVGRFEAWWEERSKLWSDGVVTISTVLRERALALGCPADRVIFLPTGAAIDRIRPVPLAEARQRLGLPVDRPLVGFIGMGQGDLEIVMAAIQQLVGVWLMVIGNKNPGVAEMAQRFGIADRLWQTGFVADGQVSDYLGCANLMCLPLTERAANRGRLPNKFLDYLCAGRPTVASPIGDIAGYCREYGVGLLAADDDFAPALDRLLSDPVLQAQMGSQARRVAETVFAWPRLIGELEMFYTRILAS
ncbi:MAG: glycosyltransferase family 4 protein [Chloroflexi bacterium]|nr:glycosyltransferase family 4 protein [Chloroflexota bacterium]